MAMSVQCTHGETSVIAEVDADYNPDLMDDLCRRASSTLVATLAQLFAVMTDD
jgi:hypothetical protein